MITVRGDPLKRIPSLNWQVIGFLISEKDPEGLERKERKPDGTEMVRQKKSLEKARVGGTGTGTLDIKEDPRGGEDNAQRHSWAEAVISSLHQLLPSLQPSRWGRDRRAPRTRLDI